MICWFVLSFTSQIMPHPYKNRPAQQMKWQHLRKSTPYTPPPPEAHLFSRVLHWNVLRRGVNSALCSVPVLSDRIMPMPSNKLRKLPEVWLRTCVEDVWIFQYAQQDEQPGRRPRPADDVHCAFGRKFDKHAFWIVCVPYAVCIRIYASSSSNLCEYEKDTAKVTKRNRICSAKSFASPYHASLLYERNLKNQTMTRFRIKSVTFHGSYGSLSPDTGINNILREGEHIQHHNTLAHAWLFNVQQKKGGNSTHNIEPSLKIFTALGKKQTSYEVVTSDNDISSEIRRRIVQGNRAYYGLQRLLRSWRFQFDVLYREQANYIKKERTFTFVVFELLSVFRSTLAEISAFRLFALYSSFRIVNKVVIVFRWAYPKLYVLRKLIFFVSAFEWRY